MILQAVFEPDEELDASFHGEEAMDADFSNTMRIYGPQYRFGYGLKYDEATMTVSVDAADRVAVGDNRPVTSAAVQVQVGNIESLLELI